MNPLLQRMYAVQDLLLDHLNDSSPAPAAVLSTFEQTYAIMREASTMLKEYNGNPVPQDVQEAVALGAQFGPLMQRVKAHLDAVPNHS